LQWRFPARDASGNTKVDFELILRLAKALHQNGAIVPGVAGTDAWPDANYDGAVAGSDNGFTAIWGRYFLGSTWNGNGDIQLPTGTWNKAVNTEIAENTYRELCAPLGGVADPRGAAVSNKTWYGVLWIYSNATGGAKAGSALTKSTVIAGYEPLGTPAAYSTGVVPDGSLEGFITVDEEGKVTDFDGILAKSYNPWDSSVTFRGEADRGLGIHPYWVFAWLFNRRIFYNQGTTVAAGDTTDLFVAPDQVARFFVHHKDDVIGSTGAGRTGPVANYAWFYRVYTKFCDADFRLPRHVEPHETPLTDAEQLAIESELGTSIAPIGLKSVHHYADSDVLRAEYPLVLTTIRYVMHYQTGATTRHQSWLAMTRPHPYLEINTADADSRGIVTGDEVYIKNMRCENLGPFLAVVGDGIKRGIVAVPWHWGNRGLATGPTANFATIDALDGNTMMPETKACLCEVTKKAA
jgi:anaerobic selenocysteine-containing dehydrogenase